MPLILLVDDNDDDLFGLRHNIQRSPSVFGLDLKIATVNSGLAALEYYAQNPHPDLAFFDTDMPKMAGYEACQRLRNNKVTSPIWAMTGNRNPEYELRWRDAGVSGFVMKDYLLLRAGQDPRIIQDLGLTGASVLDGILAIYLRSTENRTVVTQKSGSPMVLN